MSKEILEVEAEEISPLEQVIETTLVKNNVTDAVINALIEKYSGMKLKSVDDKEGYAEIKEARKEVRKIGILVEKCCKLGREDAIKVQKLWLAKEKQVLEKIDKVQVPLDAEIKKYEDEVARKEQEERDRQEQKYMARQTTLLKMEAIYENNSFTLGNVSYEVNNIREADDEIWEETMLPKYRREWEKIEAVRAEEERKKEEAAAKLREEQEKLEKEKAELARQQAEMQKQMEEMNRLRLEKERLEQAQKEREAATLREKHEAQNKARMQQVMALGLIYSGQYESFVFEDVNVANVDIVTMGQSAWDKMITDITPVIADRKAAAAKREEEKRLAEIEEAKQKAIREEQERVEREKKEAEAKRIEEEKQRQEMADKASDKEKWATTVQQIVAVSIPDFKSPIYSGKKKQLLTLLEQIKSL